ncbi:rhamnogalacturonate lyase B [Tripterygium wilfordii]|uniref:Rhamnogalacturonate lyase B n=1 Tax=Tripterygium wilfordii TaxID=458696 RepID=A0A7J7D1C9_TRIWF|nr:rhamnogalacturonate lyase B [Tripterygium wilfordii]
MDSYTISKCTGTLFGTHQEVQGQRVVLMCMLPLYMTSVLFQIKGTSFTVIVENEEQVEVSFTRTWDPSLEGKSVPLNIDKRFHYMAIADNRQRSMPLPDDRVPPRGQALAYPEAMMIEVQSWPYCFPASEDFPKSDQRGNVSGRLLVQDRYASADYISANGAYVGLAPPGEAGSWQRECKNVPDPNPKYINKLYVNHPDRQYGLWERYAELYPDGDLVYTIGTSDYTKDWFFAQVTRKKDDNSYQRTTWQIKFNLDNVYQTGTYKLRVAIASATLSELQVRVNDPKANPPLFSSGLIGRDNSIARHGIHGLYWLYSVGVPGARLVEGDNTIFFTQPRSVGPFQGIMYDYIRLEGPSSSSSQAI